MAQLAQDDPGIDVVNAPQDLVGDLYHVLLRAPWGMTLLAIAGLVLAVNVAFGVVFVLVGGVHGARAGSFTDAFFFSVQTVGTIGYGAMYPESLGAHLAVTVESIVAIVVAAISTGLVFSKFAVPTAKLEFARNAVLFRYEGRPTLAIRLANTRGNFIVDASVRVTVVRGETSKEGVFLYRIYDLKLLRDRTQALGRSWQVLHTVDEQSPLHGATEESLRGADVELNVTVIGLDGTSSQTIHGRHRYLPEDLRFGFRYEDMLRPKPDGRIELDYSKLHDLKPASY